MQLLSRKAFKTQVFQRDQYKCVICGQEGKDAHHIIERKLWDDGGYYLANGATLCSTCHLKAEYTTITCQEIRNKANIHHIVLPPHLDYSFFVDYDKWGNVIVGEDSYLRGLFFYEEATQLALKRGLKLHLFGEQVLPPLAAKFSINLIDPKLESPLILLKNTPTELITLYSNNYHDEQLKQLHNKIEHQHLTELVAGLNELPYGWRICGKLLTEENNLSFEVFNIWDEFNYCLSWQATEEWAYLLGFKTVEPLKELDSKTLDALELLINYENQAFLRFQEGFSIKDYRKRVFIV